MWMVYKIPVSRGGIKDRAPAMLAMRRVRVFRWGKGAGRRALVSWGRAFTTP